MKFIPWQYPMSSTPRWQKNIDVWDDGHKTSWTISEFYHTASTSREWNKCIRGTLYVACESHETSPGFSLADPPWTSKNSNHCFEQHFPKSPIPTSLRSARCDTARSTRNKASLRSKATRLAMQLNPTVRFDMVSQCSLISARTFML